VKNARVIVSVTNDLVTDQRVKRLCDTLYQHDYEIILTGRFLASSLPLEGRLYKTRRVKHLFNRGLFFYAEYNIRLFFFLLFSRFNILHANDLDTLPANYLASVIRRKKLVYDSHEFFTEVPELQDRKIVKKIWELIEKLIFPRLKHVITANASIAQAYKGKYGKLTEVIRNVPVRNTFKRRPSPGNFNLPVNKKLIILQGTGINRDRGAEEAIEAMKHIKNAILLIAGKGDIIPELKKRVDSKNLSEKVIFIKTLPYEKLMELTSICHCGLSLDKNTNQNYLCSLPNKLFDYIMAGIPVVVSPLPEIISIVKKYDVGLIIRNHSPCEIAEKINEVIFRIPSERWTKKLKKASEELNWDKEKLKLLQFYNNI
jgi:glycosyltransferase involved in cell wall biosynthesis